MKIEIKEKALKIMVEDAESSFPDECCGFFYGRDGETRTVEEVLVVPNSKEGDKRRRFVISPEDYLQGEKYALKNNTTLLGVYHSHPNHPARPSEHDRQQAVPFFSYIILSVMNGKTEHITSWQLNSKEQFDEETILNSTKNIDQ